MCGEYTTSYKHSLPRAVVSSAVALALTGLMAGPAAAQSEGVLEEIIVTAQKREEALQDVPISVATTSGEALNAMFSGSEDILALSGRVPGLYADTDGKVYAVDRARNSLLVYDSYLSDTRFLPLGSFLGNPFDLAMGGQGQWLFVLDNLEGSIATLDVFGGVTQIMRPELPSSMSFITPRAITVVGQSLLVLDGGADQVIEFNHYGEPVGVYAEEDLRNPRALAADYCGRFYVADDDGLYLGFADMSLPGRRVMVPELAGRNISDLWTDGVFVFVATRDDGIHMLLIDPSCGAP